jgi:hypothetical protein
MTDKTSNTQSNATPDTETQRIREAQAELLSLTVASGAPNGSSVWTPVWSSDVLERTVAQILSKPGSGISDLFHGLWDLLAQTEAPLTDTMSHFLKDIIVLCFTRYRALYDMEDFDWMASLLNKNCTEAQAYLALYAMPDTLLTSCQDVIITILEKTEFIMEARQMFSE